MLGLYFILLTWDILLHFHVVFGTDYCKFSPEHSLCGGGGIQPACGGKDDYIYTEITDAEISDILGTHNRYRNDLALGKLVGGHGKLFPKANNMEELKWDSELANIAAGTVKRCRYAHSCSKCRRTDRYKRAGENIYKKTSGAPLEKSHDYSLSNAAYSWFDKERILYDTADVPEYRSGTNSLGKNFKSHAHFTQIIWWSVLRLGCAKITYRAENPKKNYLIITCNYAPVGNIVGKTLYEIGEPCSKCKGEGRTCSKKYKGLCAAEGRPNDPDPPISSVSPERSPSNRQRADKSAGFSSRVCSKIMLLLCLLFLSRAI